MDTQARWFDQRRRQLHDELRYTQMMLRAATPAHRAGWQQRIDGILARLDRLSTLEA